jgi:hypothetical protein
MSPTIVQNNLTATGTTELVVTAAMLQATSVGIAEDKLQFTLTNLPVQGGLKLNGTALVVGSNFTQADITAGKLTYLQSAGVLQTDAFRFTVLQLGDIPPSTRVDSNSADYRTVSADGRFRTYLSPLVNVVGNLPGNATISFGRYDVLVQNSGSKGAIMKS